MDNNQKIKVALVQRIFPHYREEIFKKLAEYYDLRFFHSETHENIPQIERSHSYKVKLFNVNGVKYLASLGAILKFRPKVIIQEFSLSFLNLYLNFMLKILFGSKLILWGHGYDRRVGFNPASKLSDRFRLFLIKKADAVILYSDDVAEELSRAVNNQFFSVARNSIQSVKKDQIFRSMASNGRDNLRKEEGFDADIEICFVARLSKGKKVKKLCDIVNDLVSQGKSVKVHVVGDGEDLNLLKEAVSNKGLSSMFVFYGALYHEERVAKIIYCSDFMLIPAWLGLSVNHSFCYGTPVATLINESHPPEIQFAINMENAILAQSISHLAEQISETLTNKSVYERMRINARDYFEQQLGVNNMFVGFESAINKAISKKYEK